MKNGIKGKRSEIIKSLFKIKRRGSALAAVFIICTCVAMVAGTSMQQSTTDRRLNHYAALNAEARNAAEAVTEYGLADLTFRFNTKNSFASDELKRTKNPLKLPSSFYTVFANSNVVMPANPYDATTALGTYDTEIAGGSIPDAGRTFIDASIPGNESDVLADRSVIIRQVRVYGKATVRDVNGTTITARYRRSLQVRDAPLFSYAVFYNMTMEYVVGPAMEITGPVHTNGDLYLECDNSLTFDDKVTVVGKIYHGLRTNSAGSTVYGSETIGTGAVYFYDNDGNKVSMKSGGTWIDSKYANWYKTSLALWDGNVQDAAYSVRSCKSVAFDSYVENNPETAIDEMRDYAYQIIMPLDTTASANSTIEKQKYAYKAGLVVIVNTDTAGVASCSLFAQKFDTLGNLVYSGTTPSRTFLCTYTRTTINSDPEIKTNLAAIFNISNYAANLSTSTVTSGMYDARRGDGIDLLEVDMHKLRDALEKNDARDWGNTSSSTDATYSPATWWNGIIYFEFPNDPTDVKGADNVVKSVDKFGLRLKNADATGSGTSYVPGIPHPSWSAETGTTIATNNVMYVKGNYNADGNSGTGSMTLVDNPAEPAASLVADSITFLSTAWNDAYSLKSVSSRNAASFTEISAAVLSGIVPTNSDNAKCRSGSVNNFLRFLESFSGKTVRYRGSMISLYQSEVGDEPFSTSYFSPPIRNWGFNSLFEKGTFPPGTPNIRTYKRVNSKYLSEAEWAAELN